MDNDCDMCTFSGNDSDMCFFIQWKMAITFGGRGGSTGILCIGPTIAQCVYAGRILQNIGDVMDDIANTQP